MEKLGINVIQLIAQLVNITILVVVLKKFLYKPILSLLENRIKQIEENSADEERLKGSFAKLDQREKDSTKNAKLKADEIMRDSQRDAKKMAEKILSDAREKAAKERERRARDFQLEMTQKQREFDARVQKEAVVLANRALGTLLSKTERVKITQHLISLMKKTG